MIPEIVLLVIRTNSSNFDFNYLPRLRLNRTAIGNYSRDYTRNLAWKIIYRVRKGQTLRQVRGTHKNEMSEGERKRKRVCKAEALWRREQTLNGAEIEARPLVSRLGESSKWNSLKITRMRSLPPSHPLSPVSAYMFGVCIQSVAPHPKLICRYAYMHSCLVLSLSIPLSHLFHSSLSLFSSVSRNTPIYERPNSSGTPICSFARKHSFHVGFHGQRLLLW